MHIQPTYHVLNVGQRWSVDAHLNSVELERCFPCEGDLSLHPKCNGERMREFHDNPSNLAFNRNLIVQDVRQALWNSPHHGEAFMHSHPFEFDDLVFIGYSTLTEYHEPDRQIRFAHRVLA